MQFSRRGAYFQASRVTGPRHNFLSVELSFNADDKQPQTEALPGSCGGHGELNPAEIVRSVLEGLDLANQKYMANYSVCRIQYQASDSLPEIVYGFVMFKIVERLANGGEFVERSDDD